MWLVLVRQQDTMEAAFDDYDSNHNGRLNRLGVKKILTLLNDDIPVTNAEADWVMEATDVDGSGELTRAELRASVALWYFHVVSTAVDPRRG
jgi:Ca2+-binding EF-hand superfamily protein